MVENMPVVSTLSRCVDNSIPKPSPPIIISPTTAPVMDRVNPVRSPV